MDDFTPALPPGFNLPKSSENASKSEDKQKAKEDKPPSPRLGGIGPALPPGFVLNRPDTEDSSSSSSDSASDEDEPRPQTSQSGIGPALPPGFVPPDLGPTPSYKDDSSEDEGYGPVPHKGPQIEISAAEEFEMRAERMKNKLLKKDTEEAPAKREEWMTSLPEKMKRKMGVHVEAKSSFSRSRATGEIDDTWTETPVERAKREQDEREGKRSNRKRPAEEFVPTSRDLLMKQQIEEHNKKTKREASLVELHQKKIDKKKKKEKKKEKKARKKAKKEGKKLKKDPERVPFDRERDLQTNRFDNAMKRSMLKKAQGMSGRFDGGTQKYL